MTAQRQREIVIEFEKVQTIRKRAKTTLAFCSHCGSEADVLTLVQAANFFEADAESLFQFIRDRACHYQVGDGERIYLCVPSLLERMQQKNEIRQLMAHGE